MGRSRWVLGAGLVVGGAALLSGSPRSAAFAHGNGNGHDDDDVDVCVFTTHDSDADRSFHAKPSGGGHGGGGAGKAGCGKTFGRWTKSNLNVYVDATTGTPSAALAAGLAAYVGNSFTEWGCHSGIGESLTITFVASPAGADITVGWGDLGTTGILGQTSTNSFGGVISHSDVVMNSSQSSFSWTLGPVPTTDADGCEAEVGNGDTATSNYDLLSVLLHEIGHSLGMAHPNNQCRGSDPCYPETMYSCTDAEEYMRRALNAGDVKAIQSIYP
jgi:hypothetical protein